MGAEAKLFNIKFKKSICLGEVESLLKRLGFVFVKHKSQTIMDYELVNKHSIIEVELIFSRLFNKKLILKD